MTTSNIEPGGQAEADRTPAARPSAADPAVAEEVRAAAEAMRLTAETQRAQEEHTRDRSESAREVGEMHR
jgi:hypothetical protein